MTRAKHIISPTPQGSSPHIPAPGEEPQFYKAMGVDQSLTATGVVIIDDEGKLLHSQVIKTTPKQRILDRLNYITVMVTGLAFEYMPRILCIEGLSYNSHGGRKDVIDALYWFLRRDLAALNPLTVAPPTLKKAITGKGNADKKLMVSTVNERWNQEFTDHNLADAYGLAQFGLAKLKGE